MLNKTSNNMPFHLVGLLFLYTIVILRIHLSVASRENSGIFIAFLMDGFFKNPSYKIAMSGRASCVWRRPRLTFWLTLLKNPSIMPLGIFSCFFKHDVALSYFSDFKTTTFVAVLFIYKSFLVSLAMSIYSFRSN